MRTRLILLFIILQLGFTRFAELNHNTSSRFAALGALCSGGFEISEYLTPAHPWTTDWARTPDGRTYSNKAPGALFLAAPVYCAALGVQRALSPRPTSAMSRVLREWHLRYVLNFLLCLLLQILPWAWVCGLWERKLRDLHVDEGSRQMALAALLFGSTPAILANIWIGHPIVAIFSLVAMLAAIQERPLLLGFALGMMQLTEYSSVLLFPGALLAFPGFFRNWRRNLPLLASGAFLPAAGWIFYHERTFGGIFAIANRFQNPLFKTADAAGGHRLWGLFALPNAQAVWGLLFGTSRGLLFSQPWVLLAAIVLPMGIRKRESPHEFARTLAYSCSGLLLLFLMNASFNGWQGGATAGPRYLSAGLPVFAIPLALRWRALSPLTRRMFHLAFAYTFLVFALAKICGASTGLWDWWPVFVSVHTFEFAWKSALLILIVYAFLTSGRRMKSLVTSNGSVTHPQEFH